MFCKRCKKDKADVNAKKEICTDCTDQVNEQRRLDAEDIRRTSRLDSTRPATDYDSRLRRGFDFQEE